MHFESKIKRSMDTSLNIHMKQNCKQIFYFFMDILQITLLLNSILVLLSYSISFSELLRWVPGDSVWYSGTIVVKASELDAFEPKCLQA